MANTAPAVLGALRESRAFLVAVGTQLTISAIICGAARRSMLVGPMEAYQAVLGAAAIFGLMALAVALFQRRQAIDDAVPMGRAYRFAWRALKSELLTPEYLANVAIVFAAAPLSLAAFSAAKQAIPLIAPFSWDARIAALGATMHGGRHLFQIVQPAMQRPQIIIALDWIYYRFWSVVLLAAFVFGTLLRPSPLRRQYLLSVVLLFLVAGTVAALAFSSAGPVYYAQVVGSSSSPYTPLLQYLRSVNDHSALTSVGNEGGLWFAYVHHVQGFGYGVSAMPSVHVTSATVTALFGFGFSRTLGFALSLFTFVIWIASVNLGWHYTLDGYVGAILACCIWWFAGRSTRRYGAADRSLR
jgi:hypothetical protein